MTDVNNNELDMAAPGAARSGAMPRAALQQPQSVTMDALNVAPSAMNVPAVINTEPLTIESMGDVPVTLIFEVGRSNITIKQLMELTAGSFIEMRNIMVDIIDVRVCDRTVAHAEAIALQQWYGMRMGEVEIPATLELEQLR
ncbi:MAG: FliM/FliN family flagellar motor switch protein [Pseudomonadales bacterium]|nr:FliM/FliN family flagellar motor switch protein [Pseudomonadales bacterium]